MNSRRLQGQITIQRMTRTISPAGTASEGWTELATVRAEILRRGFVERLQDYGEAEEGTIGFRVRIIPGVEISTADRVVHAGKPLDLVDVVEVKRGRVRLLELICRQVTT